MDVFTLARVPGATETVEWKAICHRKRPFVFINYSKHRDTSRWVVTERKRPFQVILWPGWHVESSHRTLEAAQVAARRFANAQEAA